MFCSEVMMIKIFSPISKAGGLPFRFHIFINKAFLVLGHSFLIPGVFLFRYYMYICMQITTVYHESFQAEKFCGFLHVHKIKLSNMKVQDGAVQLWI